jgi:opacity protein-like surface antigen
MKHRLVALIAVVLLIAVTAAEAQPQRPTRPHQGRAGRWDFSLQTRYTASRDLGADDGSSLSFDDSLGWGFGFGYHFNDRFNLGMVFGWRRIPYNGLIVDPADPGDPKYYSSELSVSSLGVTGDWNILTGRFTPYVNGYAGWSLVDTNIVAGWGTGCWWDPWWGYICGNVPYTYGQDTGTYGLGIGGRFEVTDGFFIRVGYEHGWSGLDIFDSNDLIRVDLGLMN